MRILAVADEECKSLWDYYKPEKLAGVDMIVCPLRELSGHHGAAAGDLCAWQP